MIGRNLTVAKACKRSSHHVALVVVVNHGMLVVVNHGCPGGGGQPSREGEKVRAMADLHS